jgi:TIR domain-containing protein
VTASVFLSYASEDREAARSIGDALTSFGLEVWLDQSELGGGDAWDQKIRKQIRECDYFMPIISTRTEARHEGYFRREWRLAVERTLDMADDHLFLLPVVIDDTNEPKARVPEKFLSVQWLRLPEGRPTAALEVLCRRIATGADVEPQPLKSSAARVQNSSGIAARLYPPFPRAEPGQRLRHWSQLLGWLLRSAWIFFQRLPRWLRIILYLWALFALLSMCREHHAGSSHSSADAQKIKAVADQYELSKDPADLAKLGAQIARQFADEASDDAASKPVLAIPFAAPPGDTVAEKLADAAFAQTYGRLAVSRHGQIRLDTDSAGSRDPQAAIRSARAHHAAYVVYGAVTPAEMLLVTVADAADEAIIWSRAYPVASADPLKIASEVESEVPQPEKD